jgi:hypothetical protein
VAKARVVPLDGPASTGFNTTKPEARSASFAGCHPEPTMVLLHGTSWHLRDRIQRHGLVEPFKGRGVALAGVDDVDVSVAAITAACTRYRREQGGNNATGLGLLVMVDGDQLNDVVVSPAGLADGTTTYLPVGVPPAAIVELRRIVNVRLPKLGSMLDIATCSPLSGYAQSRPSLLSERTRDVVMQLGQEIGAQVAGRERALADLAAARETAKERGDAMLRRWGF